MSLVKLAFIAIFLLLGYYIWDGSGTSSVTSAPKITPTPNLTPLSIIITSPPNGKVFTKSIIMVSGNSSGNFGKVEIKVGEGRWQIALGTTSWTSNTELSSGLNTILARATDISGNFKESSVTVIYNPPTGIQIGQDKVLSVNGKKTFPVYIYQMCNGAFEIEGKVTPCTPRNNKEFLFSFNEYEPMAKEQQSLYEREKIYFTIYGYNFSLDAIPQSLIDSEYFFGWTNYDEPPDSIKDKVLLSYNSMKARDPLHPVILNNWKNMVTWAPYGDIITWDTYTIRSESSTAPWHREDSIYAYEVWSEQNFFKNTNLNSINKPIWAVIQANGVPEGDRLVPTEKEARANTYTAITMDVKGIGYWSYEGWGSSIISPNPNGTSGIYNNPQLHGYYLQLARELVSINDILVLPTKDYSWNFHKGFNVSFSKTLTKKVLSNTMTNFNYMLKQDGDTYYLIIVNKDSRSIAGVNINIKGLTGTMTVTTLGLEDSGSGRAGRVLNVKNGKFKDSFDGYAVHIYQMS